jgi:multiple sugar transport system ATP-binding protein
VCSIELDEAVPGVPDGAELMAGVRPHDIDLTSDGDGDGTGRVEIVEPLGPVTLVHLRVAGVTGEFVRVIVPSDTPIGVDDQTRFRIRRDHLHLFDGRTGQRLNCARISKQVAKR